MGEDNRLMPPGGMLLNIGRPVPRPAASEPSWGRVLATTVRLWVRRRWRVAAGITAVAAVAVAALAASGVFTGTAGPAARTRAAGTRTAATAASTQAASTQAASTQAAATAASTQAAATAAPQRAAPKTPSQPSAAQTAAATWIAGQVSSSAIIACDPAMCALLQAQGVAAARLMPLQRGSPGPQGAAVVVISSAAAQAYAPAVIASFGSGTSQIDVRATEPGGAAAYQTALRADLAARMSAGTQLLKNSRIHFTAQDAAQLRAGEVDTRLLTTLAALASQYSFGVAAFGDASPGVAAVYRGVSITGAGNSLTAALALVRAQVPPYLPARAAIEAPGTLNIQFAAPSPLGLLTAVLDVATR